MWMNMPTHHQKSFFEALRANNIDMVVHYYGNLSKRRLDRGWEIVGDLPANERYVQKSIRSLKLCKDWKQRYHIIPGYGSLFLLHLSLVLCLNKVNWLHWSEAAYPGARWYYSLLVKMYYGYIVNHFSKGALAIGSNAQRDFERWGINRNKIHFLPYAIAPIEVYGKHDPEIHTFSLRFRLLFLYIGGLCYSKGIDTLLNSLHLLIQKSNDVGLILVGNDESAGNFQKTANMLGLSNHVLFRGAIPASNIGSAIKSSQVVVLPSRYDGWGMALHEAASAGKALIGTTSCGSANHLIKDHFNGFLINAGDINALATCMETYARNPSLAAEHGNRSLSVYNNYNPKKNVERFKSILSEVKAA